MDAQQGVCDGWLSVGRLSGVHVSLALESAVYYDTCIGRRRAILRARPLPRVTKEEREILEMESVASQMSHISCSFSRLHP